MSHGLILFYALALPKWQFFIMRLAAGVVVVMLCTLCLWDLDSFLWPAATRSAILQELSEALMSGNRPGGQQDPGSA